MLFNFYGDEQVKLPFPLFSAPPTEMYGKQNSIFEKLLQKL